MKKTTLVIFALLILLTSLCISSPTKTTYLRIHIRANSNEDFDQTIKYAVKNSIVEFLTPIVSQCNDLSLAVKMVKQNLNNIEKVADNTLKQNGANYSSQAIVKNEKFPTRIYDNVELKEGFYDALILELGEGAGDNWWCVVYPPLCFTGEGQNYQIRSKILSIIRNFFNKEK